MALLGGGSFTEFLVILEIFLSFSYDFAVLLWILPSFTAYFLLNLFVYLSLLTFFTFLLQKSPSFSPSPPVTISLHAAISLISASLSKPTHVPFPSSPPLFSGIPALLYPPPLSPKLFY